MKLSKRDALMVYVIIKGHLTSCSRHDDEDRLIDLSNALEEFLTAQEEESLDEDSSEDDQEEEEEKSEEDDQEVEPDAPVSAALLEELPTLKVMLSGGIQTTLEFEASNPDVDSVAAILGTGDVIEDIARITIENGQVRLHAEGSPGWHIFTAVGRLPKKWKAIADGSVYEILAEDE